MRECSSWRRHNRKDGGEGKWKQRREERLWHRGEQDVSEVRACVAATVQVPSVPELMKRLTTISADESKVVLLWL